MQNAVFAVLAVPIPAVFAIPAVPTIPIPAVFSIPAVPAIPNPYYFANPCGSSTRFSKTGTAWNRNTRKNLEPQESRSMQILRFRNRRNRIKNAVFAVPASSAVPEPQLQNRGFYLPEIKEKMIVIGNNDIIQKKLLTDCINDFIKKKLLTVVCMFS